jgi:hypothetical protein
MSKYWKQENRKGYVREWVDMDNITQGTGTDTGTTIAQGMRKDITTQAAQMSAVVVTIEIAQDNAIVDTDHEIGTAMSHEDIASDPDAEAGVTSDE